MPIVAPGICRYSINGTFSGQDVVNVWHARLDTTGSTDSRATAAAGMAALLLDAYCDRVLPLVADDYRFESVSWVDLDTLDGNTGEITAGDDEVLPQAGLATAAPLPGNVAALVSKNSNNGRQFRNGRTYVIGIVESDTSSTAPNLLGATAVTAFSTAFTNLIADCVKPVVGASWSGRLVNMHTVDELYVDDTDLINATCSQTLATQRRRLRD